MVDLGYYDYFGANMNFSLDLLLRPDSNGVVLSNRRMNDHDAKGWMLIFEDDSLILKYSAKYNTAGGLDRKGKTTPRSTEKMKFMIKRGEWSRLVLSFDRQAGVIAYLNGNKVAEVEMDASEADISLNSIFNLHLFADVFGDFQMKGAIDDLRIWSGALTRDEINMSPKGEPALSYSFNNEELSGIRERVTGLIPQFSGKIDLSARD